MNGLLRWSLAGKLRAAFALAFLLLPAIGVLSYWTTLRHTEKVGWVTPTYQVIVRLESVLSLLKDIESSARGYVITGEESHLEPYRTGLLSLGQERGEIRRLLRESPAQLRRLDVLEAALVERLAVAEDLVDRRREVPVLLAAIERGDLAAVQAAGHRLKGDGGGYGFAAISEIGGALEEAARRGDRDALCRALDEMSRFLDRVQVVYATR